MGQCGRAIECRHDLIPNLVNIVQGMHNYEQTLQTELAQLRNQLAATAPGEPGPDPRATTLVLRAIQERYPDLKANSSFLNLHRNLVDTEERIALARGYFNDIATFYNDRLQTVPDRFIAALGSMKPRVLMTADDFERANGGSEFRELGSGFPGFKDAILNSNALVLGRLRVQGSKEGTLWAAGRGHS